LNAGRTSTPRPVFWSSHSGAVAGCLPPIRWLHAPTRRET